jgi:hypothetical protein
VRSDEPNNGHAAKLVTWNLGPGQYTLPTFVDNLNNRHAIKKGKLGKISQYPIKSGDRQSLVHVALNPKEPTFPGLLNFCYENLYLFTKALTRKNMKNLKDLDIITKQYNFHPPKPIYHLSTCHPSVLTN